jgi:hypothetical protein
MQRLTSNVRAYSEAVCEPSVPYFDYSVNFYVRACTAAYEHFVRVLLTQNLPHRTSLSSG